MIAFIKIKRIAARFGIGDPLNILFRTPREFASIKKANTLTSTKKMCLIEQCGRQRTTRGLCASHYTVAFGVVKRGVRSWEELEENGLALPPQRRFDTFLILKNTKKHR